ncbi:hypothetical protein [Thermomonospora umbrina]|uniref:N-acetyltransferase domain-containing protein n=1 Tax=Thermomonospora umbrina TaxID=111806 RepID=A0A3D9SLG0_9ACTN|nr:hypothetical protein [Thermomonospora umbrina]REE96766.1 hypothetical protein DFJ69_2213 [Thermomonospora umbrina]
METCVDIEGEAAFLDAESGCVFRVCEPGARPELWERFLRGALAAYRHFGVESALEYPAIRDGGTTSRFIVGLDSDGEAVAGVRILEPYSAVDEVHALRAWEGRPGERGFRDALEGRLADGIVEVKAVWTDRRTRLSGLGAAVARCVAHAAGLHGVRYSLMTASAHAVGRYIGVGAIVAAEVPPVPYPDRRYATVPLWWDARSYRRGALPAQAALIDDERARLMRSTYETTSRGRSR